MAHLLFPAQSCTGVTHTAAHCVAGGAQDAFPYIKKKKSIKNSKNFCIFFLFSQFPLLHSMLVYSLHLVVKNRGAGDPNPAAFPASPACHQKLMSPGMSVTSPFPPGILLLPLTAAAQIHSQTSSACPPSSRVPQGKIRVSAALPPQLKHRSPRASTASGGGERRLLLGPFITLL